MPFRKRKNKGLKVSKLIMTPKPFPMETGKPVGIGVEGKDGHFAWDCGCGVYPERTTNEAGDPVLVLHAIPCDAIHQDVLEQIVNKAGDIFGEGKGVPVKHERAFLPNSVEDIIGKDKR